MVDPGLRDRLAAAVREGRWREAARALAEWPRDGAGPAAGILDAVAEHVAAHLLTDGDASAHPLAVTAAPASVPALLRLHDRAETRPGPRRLLLRRALLLAPSDPGVVGRLASADPAWSRRLVRLAPLEVAAWRVLADTAPPAAVLAAWRNAVCLAPGSAADWLRLGNTLAAAEDRALAVAYSRSGRCRGDAALTAEIAAFVDAALVQIKRLASFRHRPPPRPASPAAAPPEADQGPAWAVVPGAVRDTGQLAAILEALRHQRGDGLLGGIVLSTWTGQLDGDDKAELRRRLARDDVAVVLSDEPRQRSVGHILHQMAATGRGLAACPADVFVLKLRTDGIGPDLDRLRPLLDGRLAARVPVAAAPPAPGLRFRIVCEAGMLHHLFNHTDQFFFGHRDDLLRLADPGGGPGSPGWPRRAVLVLPAVRRRYADLPGLFRQRPVPRQRRSGGPRAARPVAGRRLLPGVSGELPARPRPLLPHRPARNCSGGWSGEDRLAGEDA